MPKIEVGRAGMRRQLGVASCMAMVALLLAGLGTKLEIVTVDITPSSRRVRIRISA